MFLGTLKWISDSNVPRFVDIISTTTTIIVIIIIMQLMWLKALPVHIDYYYAICIFFPLAAFKVSAIKYSHKFWDNGAI